MKLGNRCNNRLHTLGGKGVIIGNDNRVLNMRSLRTSIIKSLLGGIVLLIAIFGCALLAYGQTQNQTANQNQNRQIFLQGAQSAESFAQHMDYYLDPSGNLKIDDIIDAADIRFEPLETSTPHFGFTKDTIWLRANIKNMTPDKDSWVVHVHENFLPDYRVYLRRSAGDIETLELHSPLTRFSERSVDFPELATELQIASEESVTLYIAYTSGGSSKISIFLETEESFEARATKRISRSFVSYGMMAIVITISLLSLLILRQRVFLSYFFYTVVILPFLMHMDGVTFQYIWPNAPRFNNYFSIIIGLCVAIVPYDFARQFLRTKIFHPRWDKFMTVMMIVTPIIIIPLALFDPQKAKQILMLLVLMSIASGAFVGILAAFKRFKEVRFYVLAWFLGAGSLSVMNLRHFTESEIGKSTELESLRLAIVVDAILMGLGVADRYIQLAADRRKADAKSLAQAKMNLTLSDRLHDLEEQYRLASELVQSRDAELKKTVHDLRQPLHALRLNVEDLRMNAGFTDMKDLDSTFTYLENLITHHLQNSVSQTGSPKPEIDSDDTVLTLSKILGSIYDMFEPDAAAKGLDFRYIDTPYKCDVEPIVLMRIVTNIVSNAIKYTSSGKIVMGVRSVNDRLRIEIHDTGLGLTPEEFDRAKARSVKLRDKSIKSVEDSGLGLHIANELAEKHGITLSILPRRQKGTSVAITVPKMG